MMMELGHADSSIKNNLCDEKNMKHNTGADQEIYSFVLDNGLTVLVKPVHALPEVSCYLWYKVGSSYEIDKTHGYAHFLEHMIFQGTQGKGSKELSKSDINTITHKLSGRCNAFTHYDYTGYYFTFPTHNWEYALPIMADCMRNCSLKEEHLNSEMRAVIQELKMRRDNDKLSLIKALLETIFTGHPYHYPIIGYKKDLLRVSSQALHDFYKVHYLPNNAVLVVVGDVTADRVYELAVQHFGPIIANKEYTHKRDPLEVDIEAKSVTLYRDIQQPFSIVGWVIPGLKNKIAAASDIASLLLGEGRGSRLYRLIVDQKQLATSLSTYTIDLFDYSLFCVSFNPVQVDKVQEIIDLINAEIDSVVHKGVTAQELERAVNKARMRKYAVLESIEEQAHEIGYYYLATGESDYAFTYLEKDPILLLEQAQSLLKIYCRPAVMHRGMVLPLPQSEITHWQEQQKASDREDESILASRPCSPDVEEPSYANKVTPGKMHNFAFPRAKTAVLTNGAKVLYYHNANVPTIDLVIDLRAKYFYDSDDMPGLTTFMAAMLDEGTRNYTAEQLADEFERCGMSFSAHAGMITLSMLSDDLLKGLDLMHEVLTQTIFPAQNVEKVRQQLLASLKMFWDNPSQFSRQIVNEHMYKGHPYSKSSLGTFESIARITRDDLIQCYKKYISPHGSKIALVGDLKDYDIPSILEKKLGSWKGPEVAEIKFPTLMTSEQTEVLYPINRDQVILCLTVPSVDRRDKDFDSLSVYDQIFGGGELGSMSSRLFDLREASGLFYTIGGSFLSHSDEQPGMLLVKTIVSLDRVEEAERAIKEVIYTAVDSITDQELIDGQNALIHALISRFESNAGIAGAFLFLERFGFSADYFDQRASMVQRVTRQSIQQAVKRVLNNGPLLTFKIGRVTAKDCDDNEQHNDE